MILDSKKKVFGIINLLDLMLLLVVIIFIIGGPYRGLGSVMVFTAIMLWVYRLAIRKMANNQAYSILKLY